MPPAPRLKVTVDEQHLTRLCEKLCVSEPKYRIMPGGRRTSVKGEEKNMRVAGDYCRLKKEIRIYLDLDGFLERESLRVVNSELVTTFLHELRHHWQEASWTEEQWKADDALPYRLKKAEIDANEWSAANQMDNRRLIIAARKFQGGGFSRLQQTTTRIQRNV